MAHVIKVKTIGNYLYMSNGKVYNVTKGNKIEPWMHFGRCKIMPYLKQWSYRHGKTRKKVLTHKENWEVFVGPVPVGMVLDHCDGDRMNPALWNMKLVTQKQNSANRGGRYK